MYESGVSGEFPSWKAFIEKSPDMTSSAKEEAEVGDFESGGIRVCRGFLYDDGDNGHSASTKVGR